MTGSPVAFRTRPAYITPVARSSQQHVVLDDLSFAVPSVNH